MQKCNLLSCFLLVAFSLSAQTQQSWEATRLDQIPALDGALTDSCWQTLRPLGAFATAAPVFGNTPHCQTEIRLFYTQTALYFAAYCYDPDSAGIRQDGSIRDQNPTGDWLQVSLDTWNDDQLAFNFTVTAAGVQLDNRQGSANWDAIWQSAVQQQADGWTVEICIPFTALRFPRKTEHSWGAQFTRYDRSSGELSTWNPQDPLILDRVLQFGNLTGIRDIQQRKRTSLALHAQTKADVETKPVDINYVSQLFGVDGRIGIGSNATLDFTLLPQRMVTVDSDSYIEFISPLHSPEPRQFIEEEKDIFDKHLGLDYSPKVRAEALQWRWNIYHFYIDDFDSKILQTSKLSARTKGNWRFGVYNVLMGPVKAEYIDFSAGTQKKEALQLLSDYLVLAAEYLLPNNSFVHVSNSMLLAGPGMTDASPQLNFRLRDRTNSLEIAGRSNFQYRRRQTTTYLDYDWNLSLARINRRWGWNIWHWEGSQAIIPVDNAQHRNAYSRAGIQYRDFSPHGPFLNVGAYTDWDIHWNNKPGAQQNWRISGRVNALDRHFRFYEIQFMTRPYTQTIQFGNNQVFVNHELSPEIGGGLALQTDNRKRLILNGQASGTTRLNGESPSLYFTFQPKWVVGKRINLSATVQHNRHFDGLSLLSTDAGRWILERFDRVQFQGSFYFSWYPKERFQLTAGFGFIEEYKVRREAVELLSGGTLQPVDWDLPEERYSWEPMYDLNATWFFSSISQVRFKLNYIPERTLFFTNFPPFMTTPRALAQLDFIWFLDLTKS